MTPVDGPDGPDLLRPAPAAVLSIVMPARNEQAGIERAIAAAQAVSTVLQQAGWVSGIEVVVVDDGSTDDTAALVEAQARADPRVVLVRLDRHRGLGAAIRAGLAASSGELVLYTDADLPFDLGELAKAIRLMRLYDADIVSAYRHDRTGEGLRRLLYSHVYSAVVRATLGVRVRDVNFAGKLLDRRVVDAIELRSEGSFVDAELLAKAERMGFRIVQFGVDYFPRSRGVSTLSSAGVIRTMLRELREIGPEIHTTGPRPKLR